MARGQYVEDALRYSLHFPTVTARSMSMGGAFTSLGGDFSSSYLNPAGLGLYRKSEFSFSPGLEYNGVRSTYFKETNEDYSYQFLLGNAAYVGTMLTGRDNGLVSTSLAIGYSRLNNYKGNTFTKGINPDNSLADYFMDYANGVDPELLEPFYERLAFDAYVIDTIPGSAFEYQTPVFLPVTQQKTIRTKGGTGEWDFSFGANLSNMFYTGIGLGIRHVNYHEISVHSEFDDMNHNDFNNFAFTEELDAEGTGLSVRMGLMVRLLKFVRIGGSIHLPTFYRISEKYYNTLRSEFDGQEVYDIKPTNSDGTELEAGTFRYRLFTPLRIMGGASVQIGDAALLAADVEYVDYSSMRLREADGETDFESSNREIENTYQRVLNIKAGGELRLGNFALRAGGAYYPSPFTSTENNKDARYGEITGGMGYRDNNVFFDLGVSGMVHNEDYFLYWDNAAGLKQSRLRLMATLGFRL